MKTFLLGILCMKLVHVLVSSQQVVWPFTPQAAGTMGSFSFPAPCLSEKLNGRGHWRVISGLLNPPLRRLVSSVTRQHRFLLLKEIRERVLPSARVTWRSPGCHLGWGILPRCLRGPCPCPLAASGQGGARGGLSPAPRGGSPGPRCPRMGPSMQESGAASPLPPGRSVAAASCIWLDGDRRGHKGGPSPRAPGGEPSRLFPVWRK